MKKTVRFAGQLFDFILPDPEGDIPIAVDQYVRKIFRPGRSQKRLLLKVLDDTIFVKDVPNLSPV